MFSVVFVFYISSLFSFFFFFSSRRRHTRLTCDWSSDVCSSDLVFYQHGGLPDLRFRQWALESRHPGHANAVLHLPIRFPRVVVRHASAMKELRRIGIHSLRDRGLGFVREAVAHGAMLLVNLGPGNQVDFIRRHLWLRVRQLIQVRMQSHLCKPLLKRHGRRRRGHWCVPRREVKKYAHHY